MTRTCHPPLHLILCLGALAIVVACAAPPAPPPQAVPTAAPTAAPTAVPMAAPTAAPMAAPTAAPALPPRYDLVLRGATLIDGTGGPPLPDAAVAIRDGRVVAVGRADALAFSGDTPVRELGGATILPGLINAHAHTDTLGDDELRAWARAGVTTVRDLGGPAAELVDRRDRIAAGGDPSLPRLLVSGPIVTVDGSFSIRIYGLSDGVLLVDGPDDARRRIDALLDQGVDLVKIATSGRTDVSWPELSAEEIAAITGAAAARGVRVVAHVDRASALRRAVESGVAEAVHSPRDRIPDDLIALMVARGVGLVPTIAVYEGLALQRGNAVEWRRVIQPVMYDNLARFAAAGGQLAFGDDYGGAPDMRLGMPMDEIRHWAAAGIAPMAIIVAATLGGARACGLEDQLGTIAPGKVADILVVQGDPLADLGALERPLLVLRGGVEVGR